MRDAVMRRQWHDFSEALVDFVRVMICLWSDMMKTARLWH